MKTTSLSLNGITALVLLFILIPGKLTSQEPTTCAENLKSAQSAFERGQVELVPGLLNNCMKSGFKREEQIAAYKLLIQSYLFNDMLSDADSTMLEFLRNFPEYQLSPTDHSSFVYLFNTFKVRPVIQMTAHFGTNFPYLTFIEPISTASAGEPGNYGSRAFNIYASVEARLKLTDRFELSIEGGYSQIYFAQNEKFLNTYIIKYDETQHRIEIPVTAIYNIKTTGKLIPFLRAGAGLALDLNPVANAERIPLDLNNPDPRTGPSISRSDSRIFADVFGQAGAGLKYKTSRGYVSLEVRTNVGIFNQVKGGGSSVETLYSKYNYVDDKFNINTLNVCFGYTYIFYKPTKIR